MFALEFTGQFRKDLKRIKKRNQEYLFLIENAMTLLQKNGIGAIPPSWKPHKLKGDYKDNWECHLLPDLLLIWYQIDENRIIRLVRAGTHSDLF